MEQKDQRERIVWLDVARSLAIVLISFNHAVNRSYSVYEGQQEEFISIPIMFTIFKVFILVSSHIGVPLFLMITGALLLKRNYSDRNAILRFYKHNLLSILITTEIWYFIMYWGIVIFYEHSFKGNVIGSIIGCVKTMLFIDQTTMPSMWYMPVILCLYLVLPFLAEILKKYGIRSLLPACLVVYISGMVVPTISELSGIIGVKEIEFALRYANVFSFYLLYVLAGYLVASEELKNLSKRNIVVTAVVLFTVACVVQLWAFSKPEEYVATYDFPLFLPVALCVFELIRRNYEFSKKSAVWVTYLSKISFAIYFLHVCIMTVMDKFFDFRTWSQMLLCVFLEVLSVSLSVIIIWFMSHVKICKKYLFLIKD